MDPQQQTRQTEKLIEEMLDFLESASEEEEDVGTFSNNGDRDEHVTANDVVRETKKAEKEKVVMPTIAQELNKLNKLFPIWNTREIVSGNKKTKSLSLPQSPTYTDEPIWRQSSLSHLDKSMGSSSVFDVPRECRDDNKNWHTKLETNCRLSDNNAYVREVCRAIYGDTNGHPVSGSAEYYQAAQNYAIYGKELLDFPQDIQTILDDKVSTAGDTANYNNGICQTSPSLAQGLMTGHNSQNEGAAAMVGNNFVKQPVSSSAPICTTATNAAIAAVASTAAYYQLCNGIQQQQARPATASLGATTYGMFLGNKVTHYVAAAPTTVSPLVYNQHTSHASTNFISNSLANAALATSPAILYSNPVLTTTTQQYLNAFFKETQFLNTAAAAAAAGGGNNATQANTATGIYERLVYAQMLQQQIYHQSQQQAVAVAAMLQHKQRINSVAAVAAARQTLMTNGTNNVNSNTSGSQSSSVANSQPTTTSGGVAPSLTPTTANVQICGLQASQIVNNSPDLLLMKQLNGITPNRTVMTVNGNSEESSSVNKD